MAHANKVLRSIEAPGGGRCTDLFRRSDGSFGFEERHPQPALFPRDLYARAAARSFALISVADAHPFTTPRARKYLIQKLEATEAEADAWVQHWQMLALQAMEERLAARQSPTDFCYGDQPGIADIGLVSQVASAMLFDTPTGDYPNVRSIYERCCGLEAFASHSPQALKPEGLG